MAYQQPPSLFDQPDPPPVFPPIIDPEAGKAAAREGAARAAASAPGWLNEMLFEAVKACAVDREEFTVDDVWQYVPESAASWPERRVMGAALNRAQRANIVVNTGRKQPSGQKQCHSNPRAVWRSMIFAGDTKTYTNVDPDLMAANRASVYAAIPALVAARHAAGLTPLMVARRLEVPVEHIHQFESASVDAHLSLLAGYAAAVNATVLVTVAVNPPLDNNLSQGEG